MEEINNYLEILNNFDIKGEFVSGEPYGCGHINRT